MVSRPFVSPGTDWLWAVWGPAGYREQGSLRMARVVRVVPNKLTSYRRFLLPVSLRKELPCLAVWCPRSDLIHLEDRIAEGEGSSLLWTQLLLSS